MPLPLVALLLLFLVLELNHHDFDGFIPDIDVLMRSSGSACIEPVGFPGLPLMQLALSRVFENFHRSAAQRDEYPRVFMSMQRQGIAGQHQGFPHLYRAIFELRFATGLRKGLGNRKSCGKSQPGKCHKKPSLLYHIG